MTEEIEATQPENEPDIRDVISDAIDQIEQPEQETEEQKAERLRDEKGRFAPKASEPETQPEAAPEEPAYQPKLNGYTAEAREVLSKLPPDVQKLIDEREEKFHRGIDVYRDKAQFADQVNKIISQDADYLRQYNVTPDQFLSRLVSVERQLRSNDPRVRIQALQGIAHDYGIKPEVLSQVPFDPYAYQLQQQNQFYRDQIEQTRASTQMAEVEQIKGTLAEFAQSHPYFDDVRTIMADLIDKGLASDIEEAYAKAIRFDDNVFQKYQASQLEEMKRQELEKANQAAKAAKAVNVQVKSGSPAGISRPGTYDTVHDAAKAAFEQLGL